MNHVFLTGFMGAGKSTVGRKVASTLGRPFIDLDRQIEEQEGASVPDIFRERGEAYFRDAEHQALEALVDAEPAVVATGGGVVLRQDNQELLRQHGTVVFLSVSAEETSARVGNRSSRPLLACGDVETARALLNERATVYEATSDLTVDTDGRTPDEVAAEVLAALSSVTAELGRMRVAEDAGGYEVVVGPGLLDSACDFIGPVLGSGPVALVTDTTVWPLVCERVAASLEKAGVTASTHVVSAGEASKSWHQAGVLLEEFAAAGMDRGSTVIAVGGGVVGDLAGFCAASYMRGIGLVHVPTTLLAQVDSAIGGKTGVDLTSGKNLAGAFWPSRLVLSDTDVLATLPAAEWTNGLVELVKGAYLEGGATLERVEKNLDALASREPRVVVSAVRDAAAFKIRIVSADLREADLRECLNFGHTLGHALELLVGYGVLSHGLAVAEGMRFAARLAEELLGAPAGLGARIADTLERIGAGREECSRVIAPALARIAPEQVLEAMKADKKSRAGAVRFVLLAEAGGWQAQVVPDEVLLTRLSEWFGMME